MSLHRPSRLFLSTLPFLLGLLAFAPKTDRAALAPQTVVAINDTLRYSVVSGESLIIALPDSLGIQAVDAYELPTPPATSWLQGYSFVWKTRPTDRGQHTLAFHASRNATETDTLFVSITIE